MYTGDTSSAGMHAGRLLNGRKPKYAASFRPEGSMSTTSEDGARGVYAYGGRSVGCEASAVGRPSAWALSSSLSISPVRSKGPWCHVLCVMCLSGVWKVRFSQVKITGGPFALAGPCELGRALLPKPYST